MNYETLHIDKINGSFRILARQSIHYLLEKSKKKETLSTKGLFE